MKRFQLGLSMSHLLESASNEQEAAVLLLCVYGLHARSSMSPTLEGSERGRDAVDTCRKMIVACLGVFRRVWLTVIYGKLRRPLASFT